MKETIRDALMDMIKGNSLPMETIILVIGICLIIGVYMYWVYYFSQKKSFFNKQMAIVIAVLPAITAGIILAMQSNLIISLGMVGALSIVRFRTAIKEPKDLLFLFWSISSGITLGATNFALTLVIAIAVPLLIFLLELIPEARKSLLLVVNVDTEGDEDELLAAVKVFDKSPKIQSRNRMQEGTDYIIECRTKQEKELLNNVSTLDFVVGASLIAHDGDAVY